MRPEHRNRLVQHSSSRARSLLPAAWLADARFAARAVRKDVKLFVFAASIIGLGVGASTAVWSVLSPLMLRELPFSEPERLVWISRPGTGGMSSVTSRTSNLRDFRAHAESFDGLTGFDAFFEQRSYNLTGEGEPMRLVGAGVADDFLDVLGVRPLHGRNFNAEEGRFDGPRAVILGHAFWQRQFGADPEIVGTAVTLNNAPHEVVGVLPSSFDFASVFAPRARVDMLTTFAISDETDQRGNTLTIIGRLAPGVTAARAQADLDRIIEGLQEADPERWGLSAEVTPMQAKIAGPFRSAFTLLAAAAAAVMLIVCVNLSNLLLAKGARRGQEMAIRRALGAPRARLIRQMLFEGLILASGGAVFGLLIAVAATRFVAGTEGLEIPLLSSIEVDVTALSFALALAAAVGVAVSVLPALDISRGGGDSSIRGVVRGAERGMSASRRRTRVRDGLVVAEVALACILLVFGGLLLRSFTKVLDVDLGFDPSGLAAWQIVAVRDFDSLAAVNAHYDRVVTEVEAIPGVTAVGLTDAMPLGRNRRWGLVVPGVEYDGENALYPHPHVIDHRYLRAMEIPLIAGRDFTAQDTSERDNVMIVNESLARAIFHGEDPLGRKAQLFGREIEIVGIVSDIRHRSLELEAGHEMYVPYTQIGAFQTLDMVVRSSRPADQLAAEVSAAIAVADPTMPSADYQTLRAVVDRSVSPRRFTLQVLAAFAISALVLAALGIYSVLSYSVSERLREIGIRMALGETGLGVVRRLVGKTLILASVGLVVGAAISLAVSRVVSSLLYSVEASDPATFLAMTLLLLAVAGLAGLFPALRAAGTNAAVVLRAE